MKFITKFNSFLINELFIPAEEIKELLEDYLLELIDENIIESSIKLGSYVSAQELEEGGIRSSSSNMTKGSLPLYDYNLNLNSCYRMADIKKIIDRISKDSNFKIWNYRGSNSEVLHGDGSIGEKTKINIRFIYMANPKADTPVKVKEISEPLKSASYSMRVNKFGESYFWLKTIEKEVEMPLEWYSKSKSNFIKMAFSPLTSKQKLVEERIDETFGKVIEQEFTKLKSVIGDFPRLEKNRYYIYTLTTESDKIGIRFSVNPKRVSRDSDIMKLQLRIEVDYFDRVG